MKVDAWTCAPATASDLESAKRTSVRTWKMVNAAREGQCQEKLWWRLVAVLTCKSLCSGFGADDKPHHLTVGSLRSSHQDNWSSTVSSG